MVLKEKGGYPHRPVEPVVLLMSAAVKDHHRTSGDALLLLVQLVLRLFNRKLCALFYWRHSKIDVVWFGVILGVSFAGLGRLQNGLTIVLLVSL